MLDTGIQEALGSAISGLREHPGALIAYVTGLLIVVVGGSTLMFRIKGGTVRVLVEAEREAPAIEHPPLTLARVRDAARFSLDRFGEGSDQFARRFLRLGLLLLVVYGLSGAGYLITVLAAYRWTMDPTWTIAGSMTAAGASLAVGAWLTVVTGPLCSTRPGMGPR